MHVEIRLADLADEAILLEEMDRRIFPPGDRYLAANWAEYETYILFKDGEAIGACAFLRGRSLTRNGEPTIRDPASLYIASTGILPAHQGRGYGKLLKEFQRVFARENGFRRLVSICRKRNTTIQGLNWKLGFCITRKIPRYYHDPEDAGVVMELSLAKKSEKS